MRTTINIPDEMVTELMKYTKSKTKTDAVNKALNDWVYHQKLNRLLELRGKVQFIDNYDEILKDQNRIDKEDLEKLNEKYSS